MVWRRKGHKDYPFTFSPAVPSNPVDHSTPTPSTNAYPSPHFIPNLTSNINATAWNVSPGDRPRALSDAAGPVPYAPGPGSIAQPRYIADLTPTFNTTLRTVAPNRTRTQSDAAARSTSESLPHAGHIPNVTSSLNSTSRNVAPIERRATEGGNTWFTAEEEKRYFSTVTPTFNATTRNVTSTDHTDPDHDPQPVAQYTEYTRNSFISDVPPTFNTTWNNSHTHNDSDAAAYTLPPMLTNPYDRISQALSSRSSVDPSDFGNIATPITPGSKNMHQAFLPTPPTLSPIEVPSLLPKNASPTLSSTQDSQLQLTPSPQNALPASFSRQKELPPLTSSQSPPPAPPSPQNPVSTPTSSKSVSPNPQQDFLRSAAREAGKSHSPQYATNIHSVPASSSIKVLHPGPQQSAPIPAVTVPDPSWAPGYRIIDNRYQHGHALRTSAHGSGTPSTATTIVQADYGFNPYVPNATVAPVAGIIYSPNPKEVTNEPAYVHNKRTSGYYAPINLDDHPKGYAWGAEEQKKGGSSAARLFKGWCCSCDS